MDRMYWVGFLAKGFPRGFQPVGTFSRVKSVYSVFVVLCVSLFFS